jgi:hypothetical protein
MRKEDEIQYISSLGEKEKKKRRGFCIPFFS